MAVSGLKAELRLLESIFGRDHERFRIASWKPDELHCLFVPPDAPGPAPPPTPLAIHCNITGCGRDLSPP
ncbi:putative Ubiquitin-conjugating enzyme E2Q family member 2 protein [Naja naja]|nr:putative Ubiquitin-conjugating enzyme E2Q family member 2 protein [Naja naja]